MWNGFSTTFWINVKEIASPKRMTMSPVTVGVGLLESSHITVHAALGAAGWTRRTKGSLMASVCIPCTLSPCLPALFHSNACSVEFCNPKPSFHLANATNSCVDNIVSVHPARNILGYACIQQHRGPWMQVGFVGWNCNITVLLDWHQLLLQCSDDADRQLSQVIGFSHGTHEFRVLLCVLVVALLSSLCGSIIATLA